MVERLAVLACLGALLVGCGSSQSIVKGDGSSSSQGPHKVSNRRRCRSIRQGHTQPLPGVGAGQRRSELTKRNLLATEARAASRVRIDVTSYRIRSGSTRGMFGMFAGKDGIGSKVTVIAPNDDRVLGASTVSTFNVMAAGAEEDIARMHASEIARFLAGEKTDDKK